MAANETLVKPPPRAGEVARSAGGSGIWCCVGCGKLPPPVATGTSPARGGGFGAEKKPRL